MNMWMKMWLKERDEVAYSFDVAKFRTFYAKWYKRGIYRIPPELLPEDDTLEITLRKMVVTLRDPEPEKYAEAKEWLLSRGYDLEVG